MIYFVKADDCGLIKIGTTIRLSERLKALSNEFKTTFTVLGVMPGSYADERALHVRFQNLWHSREFFLDDDKLRTFIASETTPWDGKDESANTVTVKIDYEVLTVAKMVAASRGESVSDYLSDLLKPVVRHDLDIEYKRRVIRSAPLADASR